MDTSSLNTYINSLYNRYVASIKDNEGNSDILTDAIEVHEVLHTRAHHVRSELLQLHGVGKAWEGAEMVCRKIRDTVRFIEDILCYALTDNSELVELYACRKLQFQT